MRSLFEFRSRDELVVANNFIEGLWSLCSRKALYNERYMHMPPPPPSSASLFQLCYSRSQKNCRSDVNCDIVANDDWNLNSIVVTGSKQLSLRTTRNNQNDRRINTADVVEHYDSLGQFDGLNIWRREFRHLQVIEKLRDATATVSKDDDGLQICVRKSPKTFNDTPANDTLGQDTETSDNKQPFFKATQSSQHLVNNDNADFYLNAVEDSERKGETGWRMDFLLPEVSEEVSEIKAIASNEDDFKICTRKLPETFSSSADDSPVGQDTEVTGIKHSGQLPPKPMTAAACDKQLENATVLYALSHQRNETDHVIGEKSHPGLSTLLLTDLLSNTSDAKTLAESTECNAPSSEELIRFFDALLVRPGIAETTSVNADIKTFQPLSDGNKDYTTKKRPEASNFVQADADGVPTTTDNLFHTFIARKQADFNKNGQRKKRKRESDTSSKLAPRLLVEPRLVYDLESTKPTESIPCDTVDGNRERYLPKRQNCFKTGCVTARNGMQTKEFNDGETRQRLSRRSRGRGKVRELIKLFESASAPKLGSNATFSDIKRATISAAVSVGELLRRASEQEMMMLAAGRNACSLMDVHAKQPTISSPRSSEVLTSTDVAQAPHVSEDKCPSLPEAKTTMHKSTNAKWPTKSRIRRKHAAPRRPACTAIVGDGATLPTYPGNRPTRNSELDARPASTNDDDENLPKADNDISKTSKADTPRCEDVQLTNDKSFERQGAFTLHSANSSPCTDQPEARHCDVMNVAGTSHLLGSLPIGVSGLPAVLDSASLLSQVAKKKDVCQLPSSSSSSSFSTHKPSKLPHPCEVVITANTLSPSASCDGDVSGRHETGKSASRDVNKCCIARLNDNVHTSSNCTGCGDRLISFPRVAFPLDQPLSSVTLESTDVYATESKETPSSRQVATNDDCQSFDAQSWFIAGGPRLVELPQWFITARKDVVAIVYQSKSKKRRLRQATLETETSCPAVYPALRISDMSVRLLNIVDVNNALLTGGNKNNSAEYVADFSFREDKRQSTKTKQPSSGEVQRVKHRNSQSVAESTKDDEQLCEQPASKDEMLCRAAATQSTEVDYEFAVIGGYSDARTPSTGKRRGRQGEDRTTTNSTSSRIGRSTDKTSDPCLRHDDQTSRRPSLSEQFDVSSTTNGTSSVSANCGLNFGEPIQKYLGSVTVVHSRRRCMSARPTAVTFDRSVESERGTQAQATESCKRLAQQFLLTSLLEYRLDSQRK